MRLEQRDHDFIAGLILGPIGLFSLWLLWRALIRDIVEAIVYAPKPKFWWRAFPPDAQVRLFHLTTKRPTRFIGVCWKWWFFGLQRWSEPSQVKEQE